MKIEYKSDEEIRNWAEDFRKEFAPDTAPPIDIIYIAEVDMGLDVIPTQHLFSKLGMDAALASDLKSIYVDEESYLKWEAGQHWIEKRMRFSFAHELGHRMLHGDLVQKDGFKSLDDFKRWAGNQANYERAEYQADEFAGRLLVPLELLNMEFDNYRQQVIEKNPEWMSIEGMREYIAKKIAPRFGVNHQVIEVRFDREGIWPAG